MAETAHIPHNWHSSAFQDSCGYRQTSIYSYAIYSSPGNAVPSALVQSSGMSCPAAPGALREQNQARSCTAGTSDLIVRTCEVLTSEQYENMIYFLLIRNSTIIPVSLAKSCIHPQTLGRN